MHDVNNARTPRATGEMRKASKLVGAIAMVVTMVATLFVAGTLNVEVAVAAEAGICTPSTGVIGDGGGLKTDNDDGVATWVGRDMYVGAPRVLPLLTASLLCMA